MARSQSLSKVAPRYLARRDAPAGASRREAAGRFWRKAKTVLAKRIIPKMWSRINALAFLCSGGRFRSDNEIPCLTKSRNRRQL
jgi:hypothetical protein